MENIEEIKRLIEKYLNHDTSATERMHVLQWMRNDPDVKEWLQFQIETTSNELNPDIKNSIYNNICNELEKKDEPVPFYKKERFRRFASIAVAACMLVVLTVYGTTFVTYSSYEAKPLSVYTATGNLSRVTLPDGTQVCLNSMSKISYFYDKEMDKRVVKLSGEAFFDVAKDVEHPFNVQVEGINVECKGTKFNINAYPDDETISVVLDEGSVCVTSDDATMDLKPNMMARYDKKRGTLTKRNVESQNYCEWVNGYIYFDNESFAYITNVISRNYGITVNILSPKLKEERFTGSIYQADIKKILSVLTAASGAHYEIISESVINLSY